jgi:hypothetical protein
MVHKLVKQNQNDTVLYSQLPAITDKLLVLIFARRVQYKMDKMKRMRNIISICNGWIQDNTEMQICKNTFEKCVYYNGVHFLVWFLPLQAQQGVGSERWQPCR